MADQGIRTAGNNIVISPASRQVLANASTPRGTNLSKIKPNIETLNKFQTRCILTQLSSLESNINANTINIGVPKIGTFRANINANTVISHANTYFSNVAAITITNSDHSDIQLGMVANIQLPSTGTFGSNTMVIKKISRRQYWCR